MKKIVLALALSIFLLGMGHVYYRKTGDFREKNLLRSSGILSPISPAVQDILSQPFSYVGHGHQSFVFGSADGRYVLKFFMKDYLKRGWVKHVLPAVPPFRSLLVHQGLRKNYRMQRLLDGYRLSIEHDPEHSGLIYVHAGQKDLGEIVVADGLGFSHRITPGVYAFALQKKAVSAKNEFLRLIAENDFSGVEQRLEQLFTLYREQASKGLYDQDRNLMDNTGFLEDRAIRQDAGKVIYDEQYKDPAAFKKEWEHLVLKRLRPWFLKHYPEKSETLFFFSNP